MVALLSLGLGAVSLTAGEVLSGLAGEGAPHVNVIVRELRLPRTLLALLVGGVLGASGAMLQAYLRNALADPGIVGVSSGAALGSVLYLAFIPGSILSVGIMASGVAGAAAGVGLVLLLSVGTADPSRMVLAGITVSAMAGAGVALVLNLAPDPYAELEVTYWLLGALEDRSFVHVLYLLPAALFFIVCVVTLARSLDALNLGMETAASLGHGLKGMQVRLVAAVGAGVGVCVAICGIVGFVGLAAPHVARGLFGAMPSRMIGPSALIGAIIVTAADILTRVVPTAHPLKLGVVCAVIGGPFLLAHTLRSRSAGGQE